MHTALSISYQKKTALLALILLLPLPTLGVIAGMILWPDTLAGKLLFFISKVWILVLPLYWHVKIDRQPISWSPPKHGGFAIAGSIGMIIGIIIVLVYITLGKKLIQPELVKNMAVNIGLDNRMIYLAGAAYWICINSVLEEYVWRWFVVKKCQILFPLTGAIVASGIGFTIHHIVAMQIYFNWIVTLLASLGILTGGVIWSWCYIRFKSIWPGYLSHALVDIAIFGVGYMMIFCD